MTETPEMDKVEHAPGPWMVERTYDGSRTVFFVNCANCGGEGELEDEDWQCEGEFYRCDWCRGTGGWWRCLSSKAWCEANPMKGREDQPVMGCEAHEYED